MSFKFSVLDIETTGLFPAKHDRIIEIAIITLDSEGNVISEFETLINPNRDLGPTNIHRISAKMVRNAPRFEEVIGDIIDNIAGNIIVGHNISFDMRFIKYECEKMGFKIPDAPQICTMRLSKTVDPTVPSLQLGSLCSYFGITTENHHAAYFDCLHTSRLFMKLLQDFGPENLPRLACVPIEKDCWPYMPKSNKYFKRENYSLQNNDGEFICEIIKRLPNLEVNDDNGVVEYLGLLDEILADRKITYDESESLFELASQHNITQPQAISLHKRYLANITRIALIDGIITDLEMKDIIQLAKILHISESDLDLIIQAEQMNIVSNGVVKPEMTNDIVGKSVCFTGTLTAIHKGSLMSREMAQKLAMEHGLIVKKGVTKDLDYLITADPDSMSGKAKKARQYNTKILAEQAFWNLLGFQF